MAETSSPTDSAADPSRPGGSSRRGSSGTQAPGKQVAGTQASGGKTSGSRSTGSPKAGGPAAGGEGQSPPWFWPFELHEQIGEGGMGVVYRGRHVPKDFECAVKMLPADVADPVVLQRFERELEVLKSLRHPNIVRCFGGECENHRKYYAMEYVSGGTLEDVLEARRSLPWDQVIEYGQQMAAALSAAHAAGVVHRDLKPANFLIAGDGTLKLADFGLAFIEAKRRITRAGKTAGTVLYMSPEQIRGQEVGPTSDLYSLGCVFYEMLSGHPPFEADAQAAILHAHVVTPPKRLGTLVMDCPVELETLVHDLLKKDPDDRPASAEVVRARLKSLRPSVIVAQPKKDVLQTRGSNQPLTIPKERQQRTSGSGLGNGAAASPLPQVLGTHPGLAKPRGWLFPAAVALALLALLAAAWQWSAARSLAPWRESVLSAAGQEGPGQLPALRQLGMLAQGDAEAAAVLEQALDDPNAAIRAAAARSVGQAGLNSMALVGRLRQLAQQDPDATVRAAAQQASTQLAGSD